MGDPVLDAMSAALSARLVGVRASLTLEEVAADGHCQHHAIV